MAFRRGSFKADTFLKAHTVQRALRETFCRAVQYIILDDKFGCLLPAIDGRKETAANKESQQFQTLPMEYFPTYRPSGRYPGKQYRGRPV